MTGQEVQKSHSWIFASREYNSYCACQHSFAVPVIQIQQPVSSWDTQIKKIEHNWWQSLFKTKTRSQYNYNLQSSWILGKNQCLLKPHTAKYLISNNLHINSILYLILLN